MTEYICIKCGYEGKRKGIKPGSTTMEVLLWVTLLIPGPFYTLWRIFFKKYTCPMCEEHTMRDVNSPLGRRKFDVLEQEISGEKPALSSQSHALELTEDGNTSPIMNKEEPVIAEKDTPQTPAENSSSKLSDSNKSTPPPIIKPDEW